MKSCYCGRQIDPHAALHTTNRIEEDYCSTYCRLYQERGMEKDSIGRPIHPHIEIPCDMCGESLILKYEFEKSNRSFCSRACYSALRGVRKRRGHIQYCILKVLKHKNKWMTAEEICNITGRYGDTLSNTMRICRLLMRWVTRGVVQRKGDKQYEYRFSDDYAQKPLAGIVRDFEGRYKTA